MARVHGPCDGCTSRGLLHFSPNSNPMKLLLLSIALACALAVPALPQFGDARSLQRQPIKPGLNCTNSQVLTWVAANNEFECSGSSAGGIVVTGTPSVGWEIVATGATTATWQAVQAANGHCTMSATTSCTITGLTGVVSKAVVSCFDNSSTLTEIIPNDFAGSTADTLVINFSAAQTGYCNASTGVGATGATGPASPPGAPSLSLQANNGAGGFAGVENWTNDATNHTIKLTPIPDPTTNLTVGLAGAGAGNVDDGDHCYAYAFQTGNAGFLARITFPAGFNTATVVDKTADGRVAVSAIAVSSDPRTARRILYRTKANAPCNDDQFFFLAAVGDNTTTTYTDNIADSSLTAGPAYFDNANVTGEIKIANGRQILSDAGFAIIDGTGTGVGSLPGVMYVTTNTQGGGNIRIVPNSTGALTNDGSGNLSWSLGSSGQAACWKTNGTLSYCESVVGAMGACTCH